VRNTRIELLTPEEERELTIRIRRGCREALHELVVRHQPLVTAMAKRYGHPNAPYEDLLHEGFVGLLDAATRFDPERGTRFCTYARWWVRHYMQRYVTLNRRMVTPSQTRNMRRLRQSLRKTTRQCEQQRRGRVPAEQLAEVLGVSVQEVLEAQQELAQRDVAVVGDGRLGGHEPVSGDQSPEEQAAIAERRDALRALAERAMSVLDLRERSIVTDRLLADRPRPLREIGERLGISRERVRQIEVAALEKMRSALERPGEEASVALTRELLAA
jgi:RNA polymerase sigma-32 factor